MKGLIKLFTILVSLCLVQAEAEWPSHVSTDDSEVYSDTINSRIVGGEEPAPHSFPYQVALFITIPGQEKKMFCGGSLLNNVFVLTAAHCVDGAKKAEVILGAHNVHNQEATQKRYVSEVFIIHKGWSPFLLVNDIALVRLPRPVEFTAEIQPIRLPKSIDRLKSFAFKSATVSGWGITEDGATEISPVLRYVKSRVTLSFICKLMFFGRTGPTHMCLDGNWRKSVCSGDSGGPMVMYKRNGEPIQHGIVSFGIGFGCEKGWPQVFTKVSRYLKWIYEHTGIPIQ